MNLTGRGEIFLETRYKSTNNDICGNPISTIKGEIHNVLSVIQSTELSSIGLHHSRVTTTHPLVTHFRELNDFLNSTTTCCSSTSTTSMILESLDVTTYITPFATAITNSEFNATITGAALSSLTKFVLYGFVSTTLHPRAVEGLTLMAKCVRYCSFEETSPEEHKKKTKQRQQLARMSNNNKSRARNNNNNSSDTSINVTVEKRRTTNLLFKTLYAKEVTKHGNDDVWSDNASDEQVVLKLISLASLIVRCPVSVHLHPTDIVGLFDTCLYIAQQPTASALLRGAAGDSMAHIVLVVFGRAASAHYDTTNHASAAPSNSNGCHNVQDNNLVVVQSPGTDREDDEEPLLKWPSTDSEDEDEPPNNHNAVGTANGNLVDNASESIQDKVDTTATATTASSPAIVTILHSLSLLADPNSSNCVQLALTLINIALETMSTRLNEYQEIIPILQNTLSKHLLQLGTTQNAQIFSLTLRVIFNLFNSLKNHLKVQLEVFLTSVHLRVLLNKKPDERMKELALSSLVEFCNEPALMMDLYYNYDCDVHCSNLFEIVCKTIAAQVTSSSKSEIASDGAPDMSALHRLAFEGILAVIDSIARRCTVKQDGLQQYLLTSAPQSNRSSLSLVEEDNETSTADAILLSNGSFHASYKNNDKKSTGISPIDPYILQQRKQRKRSLSLVASQFNKNPFADWIQYALSLHIFEEEATTTGPVVSAKSVAKFLYNTPHLDKAQMGLYLSKGPKDKYPFNAEVLYEFTSLFDFTKKLESVSTGTPATSTADVPSSEVKLPSHTDSLIASSSESTIDFSDALRTYLKKFRLPGEAQCIDRLMEAFAGRVYECATHSLRSMFKSSDAIFILAFSTIMLNTDLHNPNMDDAKRMTVEHFIRNNRGINDGENLPDEFLRDLYYRIKNNEIRVQQELSDTVDVHGECIMSTQEGTQQQWDGILSNASQIPFFTTSDFSDAPFSHSLKQAGVHEHDMFSCIVQSALPCISSIFDDESADDAVVVRTLQGFRQMARISIYFDMEDIFNEILAFLLKKGEVYIDRVTVGAFDSDVTFDVNYEQNINAKEFETVGHTPRDKTQTIMPTLPLSPQSIRLAPSTPSKAMPQLYDNEQAIAGSALHRGLLSLQCAFGLIRLQSNSLSISTWRSLIACLCKLRDVHAIPINLADLDDFGDSRGVPFPSSVFYRRSRWRAYSYMRSMHLSTNEVCRPVEAGGLWGDFLTVIAPIPNSKKNRDSVDIDGDICGLDDVEVGIPPYILEALLAVTQAAAFDQFMIRFKDWKSCNQIITALLESTDPTVERVEENDEENPLFEYHAVFTLELAARALLANRHRALELYPLFHKKLRSILTIRKESVDTSLLQFPYLMERALVTVLRACIHFFDIPELQGLLVDSLQLLSQLPLSFVGEVTDRLACGTAIILRVSYHHLVKDSEWELLGDLLDKSACYAKSWRFVLDGIASFIEQYIRSSSPGVAQEICRSAVPLKGVTVLVDILLNFISGKYPSQSVLTDEVLCLESLCTFAMLGNDSSGCPISLSTSMLPVEVWERVVFALYNAFAVSENDSSRQAMESLQRITLTVQVDSVSQGTWVALLDLVMAKQPPVDDIDRRMRATDFLGKALLMTIPEISKKKDSWENLEALVSKSAAFISKNLKNSRVSVLFESTVQVATNLSNVFLFLGESETDRGEFLVWAGEQLLLELENFGAAGGSIRTKGRVPILKAKSEGKLTNGSDNAAET